MPESQGESNVRFYPIRSDITSIQSGDTLIIRGTAASDKMVFEETDEPEYFPAPVLKRDGHTLEMTPLIDWHSEYPYRVKVQDILGRILKTSFDDEKRQLKFEAEVWNPNAIQVMIRKMYVDFSVGYKYKWHMEKQGEKNIRVADEIRFKHLGYLDSPADDTAKLEEVVFTLNKNIPARENKVDLEIEPFCIDGICSSDRNIHHSLQATSLGLEVAQRENKWGKYTPKDIEDKIMRLNILSGNDSRSEAEVITEELDIIGEREVKKVGNSWCVLHAHPKKAGSPTDKAPGTPIKCYSISEFGNDKAKQKATAMHYAIMKSQETQKKESKTQEVNTMTEKVEKSADELLREKEVKVETPPIPPVVPEPAKGREEPPTGDPKADPNARTEEPSKSTDDKDNKTSKTEPQTKTVREQIDGILGIVEKDSQNPMLAHLREAKKALDELEAPPESKEIRALKDQLAASQKELDTFKAAEREKALNEKVDSLIKEGIYKPADKDSVREIVKGMDEPTFTKFRSVETAKKAWTTEEKGRMGEPKGEEKKKEEKDEENPYEQHVT